MTERGPKSPSQWAPVVNDEMWLVCVMFAIGAWWLALGVGEGQDSCWCQNKKGGRDETRQAQNSTIIHAGGI